MSKKQIQGILWGTAPHDWANYFEPCFIPMYKRALDNLSITRDTLLLDAGCGAGLLARWP